MTITTSTTNAVLDGTLEVIDDLEAHFERQPDSTYVFGPSGERPLLADDWRTRPWRRAVLAAHTT